MRCLALVALVPSALAALYMFDLDCSQYPGPCNNDCFAVYAANKAQTVNWNNDGMAGDRRSAAGCVSPSPCTNGKMDTPSPSETSCDEYPFASVVEGGGGAVLRCTDPTENMNEGSAFGGFLQSEIGCGGQPCTVMLGFSNPGGGSTPYCLDLGGVNDGFEYVYAGSGTGAYDPARRDVNVTEDGAGEWVLYQPDPAHLFPPHLRREFLLDDGTRTLLGTRDLDANYDDAIFLTMRNDTVVRRRAVKELFGLEKTWELQDPALRKARRAVNFVS